MNKVYFAVALLSGLCWNISSFAHVQWQPQQHGLGLKWEDAGRKYGKSRAIQVRSAFVLPDRYSLKPFAPYPGDQQLTSCSAVWACAYAAKTLQWARAKQLTDRDLITRQANAAGLVCSNDISIGETLQSMKHQDNPELRIKDYSRLLDPEMGDPEAVTDLIKCVSEGKAVIVGLLCPASFLAAKEVWQPTEDPAQIRDGQAVCIIGYDNARYGGAFEVINSWGIHWGKEGFTWIRYTDFTRYARSAYALVDIPASPKKTPVQDFSPDLTGDFLLTKSDRDTIRITVADREGGIITYQPAFPPQAGIRFRIYTHTTTREYIYILAYGSLQKFNVLFPYDDAISAALDNAVNDIVYPDETGFIQLNDQETERTLCLICSKDELNIQSIVTILNGLAGMNVSAKLQIAFKGQLLEGRAIRVEKDRMSIQGESTPDRSVLVGLIEFP
jgi:hypothetical protein